MVLYNKRKALNLEDVPECPVHGNSNSIRHIMVFYKEGDNTKSVGVSDYYCKNCEGESTPKELESKLLNTGDYILKDHFEKNPPKVIRVEIL